MKKFISICLLILIFSLSACSPADNQTISSDISDMVTNSDTVKIGLGIVASQKATSASSEDGSCITNCTVAAICVDDAGKIVKCIVDEIEVKATVSASGKITSDLSYQAKTKTELKDSYNMEQASSIGKEWYEQAKSFSTYVTGKTLKEIEGIAVDKNQYPTGSDLKGSVTISIGNFKEAIKKAFENATNSGSKKDDMLGLGIVSTIENSKDASQDIGTVQADITVTAVSYGTAGNVTASKIDEIRSAINFDNSGKITSEPSTQLKTKTELGKDYGMKAASSIGKEWNEQAMSLEKLLKGKTITDIGNIALDDSKKPTSSDIKAEVTIAIDKIKQAFKKAGTM
ncbi:MAG: hypothetical protein E7480_04830 [Ruminococcaceae bacterium]|nr:hypothetical protein [Oscillospiraceae bacterium]